MTCTYLKKYQLVFIFSYPLWKNILSFALLKILRNICNPEKGERCHPLQSKSTEFLQKPTNFFFLQKPTQLLLPTNEFLTELCRQAKMHLDKLDKTVDLKKASLFIVKCKSHLMFFTKSNVA